jgi:general secretion pathway protein D
MTAPSAMARCRAGTWQKRTAANWLVLSAVLGTLGACAPTHDLLRDGNQLISQGRGDEGLAKLEQAAALDPGNLETRMVLVRQRDAQVNRLIMSGDKERAANHLDEAERLYQRANAINPDQVRARAGMDAVATTRRFGLRIDQASALLAQGQIDEAARLSTALAAEQPAHARVAELQRSIDLQRKQRARADDQAARRDPLLRSVTLDFHDANLRSVFAALSKTSGLNFVFDRDVRNDIKVTLSVSDMNVDDVIGVITATHQLERKRLNDNTVLVYPNTPAKQKDYVELSVRTFYLANADAKSVLALLKTVLKTRDIHADDKLNSLTVRDTPEALRVAEKVIATQDLAEPEVMLDVEILEVKRARLSEIGIDPPGKFTVLNLVKNPDTVLSTATGSTTVQNNTLTSTQLTLDKLRGLSSSAIGIDSPSLNLRAENGDANILANPRIRVRNRDKARVLIGDRVPVITTTSTANVGVSESVSYLDVGLKLDVEPNVFLDNEVAVKVNLEVSNIVREVKGRSGSLTYQIGTRLATTTLRLKDGETQALAGLISDEDRRSAAGIPGLTDLPVLGRLFSSERTDHAKTEIVLLLTPHVVRNLLVGPVGRLDVPSGTESSVGGASLRLRGNGRLSMAPGAGGPVAAPTPRTPVDVDNEDDVLTGAERAQQNLPTPAAAGLVK